MAIKVNQKVLLIALFVIAFAAGIGYVYNNQHHPDSINRETYRDIIAASRCVEYSPAYPSAGGGGCSPRCMSEGNEKNSSYNVIFYNHTHNWPKELIRNMHKAGDVLKKYGPLNSLDTERSVYLHITFDYFCCYSPSEGAKIGAFVDAYEWTPREVWFDKLVCAIHSTGDMVSLVLMLDEESQKELLSHALESEKVFELSTGLKKHIPHTKFQEFHMTLATVNQSLFPVRAAIDEINRIIPPRMWHSSPVIVHRPLCKRCGRAL